VTHHKVRRDLRLPLAARLMLIVAIVALGGAVLFVASGGLGRAVAALGSSIAGAFDTLSATATPGPSAPLILDSPTLSVPAEPYTNQPTVDLVVTVPAEVVGQDGTRLRIFLALGDGAPAQIDEVAVPDLTPQLIVPVELSKGANTFTVSLVGSGGEESEPSPSIRYILDQVAPKVSIASPTDDSTVNGRVVKLEGKTQPRSELIARNEANGASVTGAAGADGAFVLTLPIAAGPNGITITSTDPAGNAGQTVITVRRGSGKLTAILSSSIYRIARSLLPEPVELEVAVTDPDGRPLEGAQVTFTLSISGVQTITADAVTTGDGRATFQTTIPRGAMVGQGIATVLVRAGALGEASDRTVVTIAR
jgi:uncharacterized protein YfaP (DUF2135 family)